jgi:hypothetical protein
MNKKHHIEEILLAIYYMLFYFVNITGQRTSIFEVCMSLFLWSLAENGFEETLKKQPFATELTVKFFT